MYIKFNDSHVLVGCDVIVNENVATLKFANGVIVDTSGFNVYLDASGEYNIGGDHYMRFNTIYRNDEVTESYNGYQLSNDGSVYTEPEEAAEKGQIVDPEPTPEEIAERERQNRIMELNSQILSLKSQLQLTDYIFIKQYEASLAGKVLTEYDFESLHEDRQHIRDSINALEMELNEILNYTEG